MSLTKILDPDHALVLCISEAVGPTKRRHIQYRLSVRALQLNLLSVSWCATVLAFVILPSLAFSASRLEEQFSEPTRFLAAHGRRAWAGGYANAGLEVWA